MKPTRNQTRPERYVLPDSKMGISFVLMGLSMIATGIKTLWGCLVHRFGGVKLSERQTTALLNRVTWGTVTLGYVSLIVWGIYQLFGL
jgi:hypothetical protein